jgi:CRP/FNR family transcriptional regulator
MSSDPRISITPELPKALAAAFPFVDQLSPPGRRNLLDALKRRALPARTLVLEEGSTCDELLLVERGHLRVFKTSATGREITLYRVRAGDACVISMSVVLSGSLYPAHVEAPVASEVVAISASVFRHLFETERAVQGAFVRELGSVLTQMMGLVAEVAFRKVDQRLARWLLEESRRSGAKEISVSHEELATHLGTAREVVSRLVENFKDDGYISTERRQISVLDRGALSKIASEGD